MATHSKKRSCAVLGAGNHPTLRRDVVTTVVQRHCMTLPNREQKATSPGRHVFAGMRHALFLARGIWCVLSFILPATYTGV